MAESTTCIMPYLVSCEKYLKTRLHTLQKLPSETRKKKEEERAVISYMKACEKPTA